MRLSTNCGNSITIHPRVTQVVTQVVQPAKLGLMRYRMAKIATTITEHPKLCKPYGIVQKRLFQMTWDWFSVALFFVPSAHRQRVPVFPELLSLWQNADNGTPLQHRQTGRPVRRADSARQQRIPHHRKTTRTGILHSTKPLRKTWLFLFFSEIMVAVCFFKSNLIDYFKHSFYLRVFQFKQIYWKSVLGQCRKWKQFGTRTW